MKTLVLGGARSGKSHYAEQTVDQLQRQVIYIATAGAGDQEMQQRINMHQAQRPANWQLIEEPINLSEALFKSDNNTNVILVDCLTLWLSNVLAENDSNTQARVNELVDAVSLVNTELVMVSNEVGQGVVPMGKLTRKFVDESGRMHQKLAQVCEHVVFITAGLPQILK